MEPNTIYFGLLVEWMYEVSSKCVILSEATYLTDDDEYQEQDPRTDLPSESGADRAQQVTASHHACIRGTVHSSSIPVQSTISSAPSVSVLKERHGWKGEKAVKEGC